MRFSEPDAPRRMASVAFDEVLATTFGSMVAAGIACLEHGLDEAQCEFVPVAVAVDKILTR